MSSVKALEGSITGTNAPHVQVIHSRVAVDSTFRDQSGFLDAQSVSPEYAADMALHHDTTRVIRQGEQLIDELYCFRARLGQVYEVRTIALDQCNSG